MLVWLNGAFGVGKTTVAGLIGKSPGRWRPFDAEWVGYMLKANLTDRSLAGDFQHLAGWRRLVPIVAREISDLTGEPLVVVQTVLVEQYWEELRIGLSDQGFEVFHVFLDVETSALRARIEGDLARPGVDARQWRLDHIAEFDSCRSWMAMAADLVVDTTAMAPEDVAKSIRETVIQQHPGR